MVGSMSQLGAGAGSKLGGQMTSAIGQIPGVGGLINSALRTDPEIPYYWALELQGVTSAHFKEVSGIKMTTETQPYREGGNNTYEYHMIKGAKFEPLKLKRGFYGTQSDFYNWVRAIHSEPKGSVPARQDFSLIIFNDRVSEVARFNFFRGFVTSYQGPTFDATSSGAVAFEEIEIRYDYFEFESVSAAMVMLQNAASAGISAGVSAVF